MPPGSRRICRTPAPSDPRSGTFLKLPQKRDSSGFFDRDSGTVDVCPRFVGVLGTSRFWSWRFGMGKRIVMYTTSWCRDCKLAKRFLTERGIPYEEIDIDRHPEAAEIVMRLNDGMRKVPTLDVEGTIVSGDRFDAARFEKDLSDAGAL